MLGGGPPQGGPVSTLRCSACGHENRACATFCEECATPLAHAGSSCGAELRPSALSSATSAALQYWGRRLEEISADDNTIVD